METIINKIAGLSRNAKIAIMVAIALFTPAVSMMFHIVFNGIGAGFSIIGFILGAANIGVLFLLAVGFVAYKVYQKRSTVGKVAKVTYMAHTPHNWVKLGIMGYDAYKEYKDRTTTKESTDTFGGYDPFDDMYR